MRWNTNLYKTHPFIQPIIKKEKLNEMLTDFEILSLTNKFRDVS